MLPSDPKHLPISGRISRKHSVQVDQADSLVDRLLDRVDILDGQALSQAILSDEHHLMGKQDVNAERLRVHVEYLERHAEVVQGGEQRLVERPARSFCRTVYHHQESQIPAGAVVLFLAGRFHGPCWNR